MLCGIMGLRWKSLSDSRENEQQLDGSYWCLWQTLIRELSIWRTGWVSPKVMLSGWENRDKCQPGSFWCLTWRRFWDRNVCPKKPMDEVVLGCHTMGIWDLGTEADFWFSQTWQEGHPAQCDLNQSTEQSQELFEEEFPMCDQLARWIRSGRNQGTSKWPDHGQRLNSHWDSLIASYSQLKPHLQVPQPRRRENHKAEWRKLCISIFLPALLTAEGGSFWWSPSSGSPGVPWQKWARNCPFLQCFTFSFKRKNLI